MHSVHPTSSAAVSQDSQRMPQRLSPQIGDGNTGSPHRAEEPWFVVDLSKAQRVQQYNSAHVQQPTRDGVLQGVCPGAVSRMWTVFRVCHSAWHQRGSEPTLWALVMWAVVESCKGHGGLVVQRPHPSP